MWHHARRAGATWEDWIATVSPHTSVQPCLVEGAGTADSPKAYARDMPNGGAEKAALPPQQSGPSSPSQSRSATHARPASSHGARCGGHLMVDAAARRRAEALPPVIEVLRQAERDGYGRTITDLARAAMVSRAYLYTQSDLVAAAHELRELRELRKKNAGRTAGRQPSGRPPRRCSHASKCARRATERSAGREPSTASTTKDRALSAPSESPVRDA